MSKILWQNLWFFLLLRIKVSSPANIKKEKISTASDVVIDNSKPARANRKEDNVIRCDGKQIQPTSNNDRVQVKAEAMITNMDTVASLHEKFPKASPFEFEFLLFLKEKQLQK